MKLPFVKNEKEKPVFGDELYISLDIGTEVLKSLLFRCSDLGVHVLKSSRIFQQQHAMKSGVIKSLDTVIDNCKLSIGELTKGLDEKDLPKKVVMGIAGELVNGVSIVVTYDREDRAEKEVSEKEQANIFNKVHDQVLENGKQDLAQKFNMTEEDIEILHITITGVEIGGMPVDSLIGYSGKNVRLNFYASFAPKTYLTALRKVADSLNMELGGIVFQPFAMARVVEGASDKNFNGIFIDVGGGTTDIAVVKNGNIVDTQVFAFGGRVFTKKIAEEMNLDYRHAESRKLKYSAGELDDKIAQKVRPLVKKDVEVWIEGVEVALESMEDIEQFPHEIYLCGGGSMLPDLKRSILEYPWTSHLNFMRFPRATVVTPEKLDMVFDKNRQFQNSSDITPAGLAKFLWDKLKYPQKHFEI